MTFSPIIYTDDDWSVVRARDTELVIIPTPVMGKDPRRNKYGVALLQEGLVIFTGDTQILTEKIRTICADYLQPNGRSP